MELLKVALLFAVTAVAEIVGCYLPWLVVKQDKSAWLLLPAAFSLALFAWLLTLHPTAAGRTYAAYGGTYIAVALVWLHVVDGIALSRWDFVGAAIALVGMAVIAFQPATGDAPLFYALGRLRHAEDKHNSPVWSKNRSKQISRSTPTKTPVQSNPGNRSPW